MQLQRLEERFEELGVSALGIAVEENELRDHPKVLGPIRIADPFFRLLADVGYEQQQLARTTAYLVGQDGTVLDVYPMLNYARAPWPAIVRSIGDKLAAGTTSEGM